MSISLNTSLNSDSLYSTLQSTSGVSQPGGPNGTDSVIATAAKALGMSPDAVTAALKSGQSLDDLAAQQGVSQADLVAALKAGMPAGLAASGKADEIATKIAAHKGLPRGHHHGPPPASSSNTSSSSSASSTTSGVLGSSLTPDQQSMLDKLSGLLGTTSNDLLGSLQSGESLADLLSAKGIDNSQLAGVVQGSLYLDTKV